MRFTRIVHADWSVNSKKRWRASAVKEGGYWAAEAPHIVGPVSAFLDDIFGRPDCAVLAGFDFPIGVPAAYGRLTGLQGFPELLRLVGAGEWREFSSVADIPSDVSIRRPFYPRASRKGVTRASLAEALGVSCFDDLLRHCERATAGRQAACSLFWTLGGNQVGKAALTGWSEVVRPAMVRGARLWPFEGSLSDLAQPASVVLTETYPAEAYGIVGARFRSGESKRRQSDRARRAPAIFEWCDRASVNLSTAALEGLAAGFGADAAGEDRFDAFMGLLKMIAVVDGIAPERSEAAPAPTWEGWILGR